MLRYSRLSPFSFSSSSTKRIFNNNNFNNFKYNNVTKRNIFIPLTPHPPDHPLQGKECTLYIKGFLAKGEHADHFEGWQRGHKALIDTHQWGPIAHGYYWKSGDLPGSLVPYATLLTGAYHLLTLKRISFTPQGIALTAAAEAVVIGGKFWHEFRKASETAKAHGPSLAAHIQEISQKYPYVRIVAHSLGCALLVEALKILPKEHKPHEIHLLAPVLDESSLHHNIAKEHTYLYHCGNDFALQTASTLFYQKKQVVGLSGPNLQWHGLTPVDVSNHFGFFVHTNYKDVLHKIVVDHRKSYDSKVSKVSNLSDSELALVAQVEPLLEQELESELVWKNQTGSEFLAKLESELKALEKEEQDKERTKQTIIAKEGEGERVILSNAEKAVLSQATVKIEGEKGKEKGEEKEKVKKEEGINVQAIVEESVQKLEGVLKEKAPELVQVGKAFLQNVKVLMDSRKDIAKSLADAIMENVPSGKGKK